MKQDLSSPVVEAFDAWSEVYDTQPNPLLALEERVLGSMMPDVRGLDVLDAGCGTGRWLQRLARSLSEELARCRHLAGDAASCRHQAEPQL